MFSKIKNWFKPKKQVLTEEVKAQLREKAKIGASNLLGNIYGVSPHYFHNQNCYFADAIVQEINLDQCYNHLKNSPNIHTGTKEVFLEAVYEYLKNQLTFRNDLTLRLICERLAERLLDAKLMTTNGETFQLEEQSNEQL